MGTALVKIEKVKGDVLPMPDDFMDFVSDKKDADPAPTLSNARIAIHKLGLYCWHDLFSGKKYIGNQPLNSEVGGQVTDEIISAVRVKIRQAFRFDPGMANTAQAINLYAREHGVHPVREYLLGCYDKWDPLDTPRLDTMLIDYFKAADTPLIRAISRIVMVGSVKRIFEPGCKFDYCTVIESPEGYNKSTALIELYGAAWHTDNSILGMSNKELQETVAGKWCVECAELSGMRKADVEKVKNQLSKIEDSTRMAYGRYRTDAPRSCVFWGTTNDQEYLRSQTGNRRFLPARVGRIDLEALRRDRDLLWGEAVAAYKAGESVLLPEEHWQAAGIEQEARTLAEPWIEQTANVSELAESYMERRAMDDDARRIGIAYQIDRIAGWERVTSQYVLDKVIGIPPNQQIAEHGKRLGQAMRKHGWDGPRAYWIGGRTVKGFERRLPEPGDWE